MGTIDWMIVAGYFSVIFVIAGYISWRQRQGAASSTEYFLAGRHAGWWLIGASLFAANIGSEHLVGLAGAGATSGVAMGQFEIFAIPCLLVLSWVFVPFYIRNGVFTMPEFLEKRFSPAARWYLAIVSIIAYVLTKISVTICAGGVVIATLTGINFWYCAVIIVVGTGIYTLFGGLRAVLCTDFIQIFVILLGSALVTLFGLAALGAAGIAGSVNPESSGMFSSAFSGWGEMKTIVGPEFLNMWKPMNDPSFPWTGIVFGIMIIGVWYWCTDQFIVQRVLSARNIDHARAGALFGASLKLLPLFLFVIPGMIAFCLKERGLLEFGSNDEALPAMVRTLLPVGLRGIVVAGFLAALTSSLASVFNSCSTLVTMDVYKKLKPDASEKSLVRVGRVSTLILIGFGLAWIPMMKLVSGQLYGYLQSVQAYISPPVAAVFLLGVMFKRLTSKGALASLGTGFLLGMGRLVLEINKDKLAEGTILNLVNMNFLHFGVVIFLICCAVMVAVSVFTQPKSDAELKNLTFQTGEFGLKTIMEGNAKLMIVLSVLIMAVVSAIWIYFSKLVQGV